MPNVTAVYGRFPDSIALFENFHVLQHVWNVLKSGSFSRTGLTENSKKNQYFRIFLLIFSINKFLKKPLVSLLCYIYEKILQPKIWKQGCQIFNFCVVLIFSILIKFNILSSLLKSHFMLFCDKIKFRSCSSTLFSRQPPPV